MASEVLLENEDVLLPKNESLTSPEKFSTDSEAIKELSNNEPTKDLENKSTATTSDPDGSYSKALQISDSDLSLVKGVKLAFTKCIRRLLSIWKPSFFNKCFEQFANSNPLYLDKVRMVVMQPIELALVEDVSFIVANNLLEPLKILSALKKESRKQNKTWRPSGIPSKDIVTRDVNVLQYEKFKFEKTLEEYKNQSEKMQSIIANVRRKAALNNQKILRYRKGIVGEVLDACNRIPSGPQEK